MKCFGSAGGDTRDNKNSGNNNGSGGDSNSNSTVEYPEGMLTAIGWDTDRGNGQELFCHKDQFMTYVNVWNV